MAKFSSLLALAILFWASFNICRAHGYEFTVGDGQGWREPEGNDTSVYTRWAAKIRFQIGDSVRKSSVALVFSIDLLALLNIKMHGSLISASIVGRGGVCT